MTLFENKSIVWALCTAFTSIGGYIPQPIWYYQMSKYYIVQLFAITVLIYQGGGRQEWLYSISIALLFSFIIKMSKYITFGKSKTDKKLISKTRPPTDDVEQEVTQVTEPEPESEEHYYNY